MARPGEEDPRTTPLERVIRILIEDPGLRPVLIVMVLILGTFVAGGVLQALGRFNPFALAGVVGLVLMTLLALDNEIRSARRVTLGVWAIASVWLAAAVIGGLLRSLGAF